MELSIFQTKLKKLIDGKYIKTNIYRAQENNSTMCGYFCIGLISFTLKVKSLSDYINLYSPNEYEKNEKLILKYFQ